MKSSRTQLLAQIYQVELELYKEKENVMIHKAEVSKNYLPYMTIALTAGTLFFIVRSKDRFKKIASTVVATGKLVIFNYLKNKISLLLLP